MTTGRPPSGMQRRGGNGVDLVLHHDGHASRHLRDQFGVAAAGCVIACRMRGIEHHQHDVGVGEGLHRFAHADALGFVECVANAGGVHQAHRNSTDRDRLAHQVAGGAGRGGDDGALVLDQAIEQARLADVGPADDGQRQTFVHDLSVGEAGEQLLKRLHARRQCAPGSARRQ